MRRPFGKIRNQIKGTSMPEAFVVTPATRPAPLNVVGEQITVLASGFQTGGYEIFRQAFGVGDKDMIAEPGTLVHLPAGTMHWFRYGKGGGEMISMTSREAPSLFFTDVHRAISPETLDIPKFVEIANKHQLTVAAPPG
jgi:hypothetical protein